MSESLPVATSVRPAEFLTEHNALRKSWSRNGGYKKNLEFARRGASSFRSHLSVLEPDFVDILEEHFGHRAVMEFFKSVGENEPVCVPPKALLTLVKQCRR
jgi:hypothetical protein